MAGRHGPRASPAQGTECFDPRRGHGFGPMGSQRGVMRPSIRSALSCLSETVAVAGLRQSGPSVGAGCRHIESGSIETVQSPATVPPPVRVPRRTGRHAGGLRQSHASGHHRIERVCIAAQRPLRSPRRTRMPLWREPGPGRGICSARRPGGNGVAEDAGPLRFEAGPSSRSRPFCVKGSGDGPCSASTGPAGSGALRCWREGPPPCACPCRAMAVACAAGDSAAPDSWQMPRGRPWARRRRTPEALSEYGVAPRGRASNRQPIRASVFKTFRPQPPSRRSGGPQTADVLPVAGRQPPGGTRPNVSSCDLQVVFEDFAKK